MILRTVSAAFLLRDAFTGMTLTGNSATLCLLDGRPLRRPIWKKDGYLILTDLAPGDHELRITRLGYREETVPLTVEEGAHIEDTIALKPGTGYRFPRETVRVSLRILQKKSPAAGGQVWLGLQPRTRLKLAQDKAEAGEAEARLFCDGNPSQLPIPGHFLVMDQKAPELIYLRSLRGETGLFALPLASAHGRGTEFVPVESYGLDEAGRVQVLLRQPGTLTGFCGGQVFTAELAAGEQDLAWELEG